MDGTSLALSVLFGSIGMGLCIYGKRQGQFIHLGCGVVLMVLPYLVPDALMMGVAGLAAAAAPFVIARL